MTKLKTHYQFFSDGMLGVFFLISLLWLRSGVGKVWGETFTSEFAKTTSFFASDNPYPLVRQFLQTVVLPQAVVFGTLTMWGEVLTGLSIMVASYLILTRRMTSLILFLLLSGLCVGVSLNGIFYFVSGHTSPASENLNILMLGIQVVGILLCIRMLRKKYTC